MLAFRPHLLEIFYPRGICYSLQVYEFQHRGEPRGSRAAALVAAIKSIYLRLWWSFRLSYVSRRRSAGDRPFARLLARPSAVRSLGVLLAVSSRFRQSSAVACSVDRAVALAPPLLLLCSTQITHEEAFPPNVRSAALAPRVRGDSPPPARGPRMATGGGRMAARGARMAPGDSWGIFYYLVPGKTMYVRSMRLYILKSAPCSFLLPPGVYEYRQKVPQFFSASAECARLPHICFRLLIRRKRGNGPELINGWLAERNSDDIMCASPAFHHRIRTLLVGKFLHVLRQQQINSTWYQVPLYL